MVCYGRGLPTGRSAVTDAARVTAVGHPTVAYHGLHARSVCDRAYNSKRLCIAATRTINIISISCRGLMSACLCRAYREIGSETAVAVSFSYPVS